MSKLTRLISLTMAVGALLPLGAQAASTTTSTSTTTYTENFTGGTTANSWYYINGACLTAGTLAFTSATSPGVVPSCASMTTGTGYYNLNYAVGEPLVGGTSGTIPGTDPTLGGALRFTNYPTVGSYPSGYFESGAILSNFTFPLASQGIQITFVTETYEGNSGGGGSDGADGISFFLQDAGTANNPIAPDLGATGGSLAYTCSNTNNDPTLRASGQPRGYDGVTGGYIGLGIDEYGNFLNAGDNTATGYGYQWNRIGLRGAGSVAWAWLNAKYPTYYPSGLNNGQRAAAVQATCSSGVVMNYSDVTGSSSNYGKAVSPTISVPDYPALSYHLLNTLQPGIQIANESAIYRGNGTSAQSGSNYGVPISYNLKITTAGLLTLSYSYNGGASVSVITGQNITTSNGSLPANVRFAFAGSDGGATNIHEIMCFQASPQTSSASSASGNQKQSSPVVQGTQVYFSYYDPTNWSGSVTSDSVLVDSNNNVTLNSLANWDASCVLTLIATGSTCSKTGVAGPNTPQDPLSGRIMLTWGTSGTASKGVPFEWGNLTAAQQAALDTGDTVANSNRLQYLRGVRTGEQNSSGTSGITIPPTVYRARVSVLGDIVDSSPTWVGPPSAPFPNSWIDLLNGGTMPENATGTQNYSAFATALGSRMNVVYAGANDGFLHGFRSGYFVNGVYQGTGSGASFVGTNNDGQELLAYMPSYVLNNIQSTSSAYNYADVQYAHQFDVDATPGVGDLFYNNLWHTWLVGGLGAGGAGLYALDITNPADNTYTNASTFSESNAASLVIGDWTASTLTCTFTSAGTSSTYTGTTCGGNLGKTFGTPQIRRFHNGMWGAVFGNGFGSASGDAGIFIMLVSSTGTPSFIYLSTGTAGQTNGIAYVTPADLDADHITDYVYAGDLKGNIWRFDLTSSTTSSWAVTSSSGTPLPLFNAGQPITTRLAVLAFLSPPHQRLMIEFGTGQAVPLTPTSATTYLTAQQSLYGIWDWNLATWNAASSSQYDQLPYAGVAAPTSALSSSMLQQQTLSTSTVGTLDYRSVTNYPVCWPGLTGCTGAVQYGWSLPLGYGHANPMDVNLPSLTANTNNPTVYEQVIFNPIIDGDTFIINTTIPSASSLTNCFSVNAGGYTMAINPATGGSFPQSVFTPTSGTGNNNYNGVGLSGTGSVFVVTTGSTTGSGTNGGGGGGSGGGGGGGNNCGPGSKTFGITQTQSGTPTTTSMNVQCNVSGGRLTWVQRR